MTTWDTDFTGGARLRRARTFQRLSLVQLAQTFGVHKNTVLRWEQGEGAPTPAMRKVVEGFIQNAERIIASQLAPSRRFSPLPITWIEEGPAHAK